MSEGNGTNGTNGVNGTRARWAGVLVTIILATGAMTVQWGVVTTKLQQLEKRMDEFIGEARSIRGQGGRSFLDEGWCSLSTIDHGSN